jgi:hypothetical protein
MTDRDSKIFERLMNTPITDEDNHQEYHSVDITPENSFLPQKVDKSIIKSNIQKVQAGVQWSAKTAEVL